MLDFDTNLVHTASDREVGASVIFGSNQDTVPLCCSHIDHVGSRGLCVDTVDFNNGHFMTFKPDILSRKGTNVNHTEKIGLARLNRYLEILCIIHKSRIRNWLCTSWIADIEELLN